MPSLPHIQNQIREHLSELCEACFSEQEWLEEGRLFEANHGTYDLAGSVEALGSEDAKSADAA